MTGYSKTKNFVTGETIEAGDFTFEFNALTSAFDGSTGHNHSGGTSGPVIATIGSSDLLTKITTTVGTDQINFYAKNSSDAAELQFSIKDGVLEPDVDGTVDIGTTAKRFKDLYVDSVTVTGNIVVDGTVDGIDIVGLNTTVGTKADDNAVVKLTGNQSIAGVKTFSDNISATTIGASGAITGGSFVIGSADISETELETIDGVTAGTVSASKAVVVDANLDITGFRNITLTGEVDAATLDVSGNIEVDGTVDGRDISADGLILDAIEAGADVTDTDNVVAALTAGTNISIAANGTISSTDTNTTYSTATSSTAGLVKIGYVENDKNYPVELNSDQMYVNVPWTDTDTNTTYSEASSSVLGLVKIGYVENNKNYPVELDAGKMYVNVPWVDTGGSVATSSSLGTVKIGYVENDKNYPVELASEKMYVNVPWTDTDTNTTYTAGTGLSLSGGNEFSVDAAQTQITSVGTLGSLNVTGDVTLNGSYPTGTSNTFIGSASRSALDSSAFNNTGIGSSSLLALTTGDDNVAVGSAALTATTTGSDNVALGKSAAQSLTTASGTIAIGKGSLFTSSTASNNTAIGDSGLYNLTSGTNNVGIGNSTGFRLTSGLQNTFIGYSAGYNTNDSNYIVAIGSNAGRGAAPDGETINYTGGDNTIAIGNQSLYNQTSGSSNIAIGKEALKDCTTGYSSVAIGTLALTNLTTGTVNTAVGESASEYVTTSTATTALGMYACRQVSTGNFNTGIGWRALSGNPGFGNRLTGANNTAIGSNALISLYGTSANNLAIGNSAGSGLTEGSGNVLIGLYAGSSLTTASNQTIIGGFGGNSAGLDLRTDSTNRIILSTGNTPVVVATTSNFDIMVGAASKAWSTSNGGVRFIGNSGTSTMNWSRPSTANSNVTVAQYFHNGSQIGNILTTTTGTAYNTSSDYRLKENVSPLTGSIDRLKALKPCTFNFITEPTKNEEGFIAHEVQEVVSGAVSGVKDAVDEDGNIDAQGLDTSRLVPLLTSALQEAVEKIEQLEQRISALES